MDYFEIGQRIRKYRRAYSLSQEQLAEKVGISTTHMSHIETGNTKLSLPVLVDIAKALDVRTDEIIYGTHQISKTPLTDEIISVLESCTISELYILLDTMKALKISFEKYRDI